MLAQVRFWLEINVYALLLDVLSLTVGGVAIAVFPSGIWLSVFLGAIAVYSFYGGMCVHGTYRQKKRMYITLLRRNRGVLHQESFRDFMAVPCHRIIVRMVLDELGKQSYYATLKRMYYRYPWENKFQDTTIVHVFKTKEEGDLWLSQQKGKNL